MTTDTFARARGVIARGLGERAFPACTCEVGRSSGPLWTEAFGRLSYDVAAPLTHADTLFDLASLTKVIATTSVAMDLVQRGALALDTPVADVFPEWRGTDRESIRVADLLDHASGLPAHARLWEHARGRDQFRAALLDISLERPCGSSSVYSDVGVMLLGLLLEEVADAPLDVLWDAAWHRAPSRPFLGFRPAAHLRTAIAPTEVVSARGGPLQGVVHDENADALGGVAGHAGMFGGVAAVGLFAAAVLTSFKEPTWLTTPDVIRRFAAKQSVPGSSRALGWDTMLPSSSCGTLMSRTAIGHTGFTGTSLWIDWERDVYVVLLTNRVHPTRTNERFLPYRAAFHDAVMTDLINR
jgi:CubicO group peptidase (beta-lactamase class C family)